MENIIPESLNTYLSSTRLSMNQIAGRWGVSAPLLSQIKSGKKQPGVELGLKILREAGVELGIRKEWLEKRSCDGDEAHQVYDDCKKERVQYRLQKDFCEHLAFNPIVLDIFLDISLMEDVGLSWSGILKNYGEYGLSQLDYLLDSGLVIKKNDRYFVIQDKLAYAMNPESSFALMQGVLEVLRKKVKQEEFKGEFHFDITDVTPEAYNQLKELNIEYTKKMVNIVKENQMSRLKGGLRIVAQNLVGIMKTLVIILLFSLGDYTSQAQGVTGGASGKVVDGPSVNLKDLKRGPHVSGFYGRAPRAIRSRGGFGDRVELDYRVTSLQTPHFNSEEDAISGTVKVNEMLQNGQVNDDEARTLAYNIGLDHNCNLSSTKSKDLLKNAIKQGAIKPLGFKVEKSYSPDGRARFQAVGTFYSPCHEDD